MVKRTDTIPEQTVFYVPVPTEEYTKVETLRQLYLDVMISAKKEVKRRIKESSNKDIRMFLKTATDGRNGIYCGKEQNDKRKVGKKLRFYILDRDNFTCRYCGRKAPDVKLHVDHITPWSMGGETSEDNLCACCSDCNLGKSNLFDNGEDA